MSYIDLIRGGNPMIETFKICPECQGRMYIDSWNGWVWSCIFCDHVSEVATKEEIEEAEKIEAEYFKKVWQKPD